MPEQGQYEKLPRPSSIAAFTRYLSSNPMVAQVERLDEQIILVRRIGKSDLRVYLTNVYIVGLADVHEILFLESDIDAIVTMSAWNSYSREAKEHCRRLKVGLFKFKEFLGAVYYDGKQFFDYTPPGKGRERKDSRHREA